jgi:hypothetical protein
VIFTIFCIIFALSLPLSVAGRYLIDSITSNRDLPGFNDGLFLSWPVGLILILIVNQPPIQRWFMRHKWKWNVSLLLFFPVIAFLLMFFSATLNLLTWRINWNYRRGYDLEDSLKDLGLWFISIYLTGTWILFHTT